MSMQILVVGGAGYIGSHVCKNLFENGFEPVILDDLSRGHREFLQWGTFCHGSLDDSDFLDEVFRKHSFQAVIHLASLIEVGESVRQPELYFQANTCSSLALFRAMLKHAVSKIVFSSSCAVYGEPQALPLAEDHPRNPLNPYGQSKFMVEMMLESLAAAHPFHYVNLRYFNASGADPENKCGEWHVPESHLIPRLLDTALNPEQEAIIYGNDYETRDGTCIRDFIHVSDLASAHTVALQALLDGQPSGSYNLGSESGFTVLEVLRMVEEVTGKTLPLRMEDRRPGDMPALIGSSQKFRNTFNWTPEYSKLNTIISTAWTWHQHLRSKLAPL